MSEYDGPVFPEVGVYEVNDESYLRNKDALVAWCEKTGIYPWKLDVKGITAVVYEYARDEQGQPFLDDDDEIAQAEPRVIDFWETIK